LSRLPLSRRAFLRAAGTLSAGGVLAACRGLDLGSGTLHLALISDVHMLPNDVAVEGLQRALDHIHQQRPAVQAILNAGDSILDALQTPEAEVAAAWDAFTQTMQAGTDLPVHSVIGNHDVWGWGLATPGLEADPHYGKAWAIEALGLPAPYYAFGLGEWQFYALDSTHRPTLGAGDPYGDMPYTGRLDDPQFEWLKQQLAQAASSALMLADPRNLGTAIRPCLEVVRAGILGGSVQVPPNVLEGIFVAAD
jgi:Icc protein